MRTVPTLLAVLSALTIASVARADDAAPAEAAAAEKVTFRVSFKGHTLGTETMRVETIGDSLRVTSHTVQVMGASHPDSLVKNMVLVVDAYDLNLRSYSSVQRFAGHEVSRGLTLEQDQYTSYRETDGRGAGDTFERPPGRLFVLDPGLFSSFDLICRMLRGRPFEKRPLNCIVLGARDTVMAQPLVDGGPDTLRLGARRVIARRFTLGSGDALYQIWMDPLGHMLRFENSPTGLRVERVAPPVRRRAGSRPPSHAR